MTVARLETVSKHPSIVLASANGGDVAANPEAPILEAVPNSTDRARAYKMRCADSALLGAAPLSPVPCKAVRSGQNHSLKCPSSCSKRSVARRAFLASQNTSSAQRGVSCWAETAQAPSTRSPLRLIQHKDEAFWFYRFLSIVYDKIGEPRSLASDGGRVRTRNPEQISTRVFVQLIPATGQRTCVPRRCSQRNWTDPH